MSIEKINLTEPQVLDPQGIGLTNRETGATTVSVITVRDRFIHKLEDLLREAKQTRRDPKKALATYCRKESASWVSNLLSKRSANPRIDLEDLWNIAGFFRVTVGELLGAPRAGQMDADEHRLLAAFRVLPDAHQDHFLALLESAALGVQIRSQTVQPRPARHATAEPAKIRATHAPVASQSHPLSTGAERELIVLRAYLTRLAVDLGTAAAGGIHDDRVVSARTTTP
jgi:transcriptional regulator with XRE-family HTH domain